MAINSNMRPAEMFQLRLLNQMGARRERRSPTLFSSLADALRTAGTAYASSQITQGAQDRREAANADVLKMIMPRAQETLPAFSPEQVQGAGMGADFTDPSGPRQGAAPIPGTGYQPGMAELVKAMGNEDASSEMRQIASTLMAQQYRTGERVAGQGFRTGERVAGQGFRTGERVAGQGFRTGEREAGEGFRDEQRIAGEGFRSGERVAGEGFRSGERISSQDWRDRQRRFKETFTNDQREEGEFFRIEQTRITLDARAEIAKLNREQQKAISTGNASAKAKIARQLYNLKLEERDRKTTEAQIMSGDRLAELQREKYGESNIGPANLKTDFRVTINKLGHIADITVAGGPDITGKGVSRAAVAKLGASNSDLPQATPGETSTEGPPKTDALAATGLPNVVQRWFGTALEKVGGEQQARPEAERTVNMLRFMTQSMRLLDSGGRDSVWASQKVLQALPDISAGQSPADYRSKATKLIKLLDKEIDRLGRASVSQVNDQKTRNLAKSSLERASDLRNSWASTLPAVTKEEFTVEEITQ